MIIILFYRSVGILINLIEVLIIIRIFMSILNIGFNNLIGRFVYEMTEPVLGLARNVIYKLGINTGMFDFSPLLAIFFMRLLYSILRSILF